MDTDRILQLRAQERRLHNRQMMRQPGLMMVIACIIVFLLVSSILPILNIFITTFAQGAEEGDSLLMRTLTSRYFWLSFWHSILLGGIVATLATGVGFIYAFATTRTEMPGKGLFQFVAMFPIVSPPFVIALAMILLFGRSGVITKSLLGMTHVSVYGIQGLIPVQTLALFPLAYLNIRGAMESINTSVEDAAQCLGAGRWHVFRSVTLPLCLPAIMSAFLIVFIKSISDFGNPQVLGGDYMTLSSQAYLQINGLHNVRSGALIAVSILFPSMLAFLIQKYWVSRKSYVSVTGKPVRGGRLIYEKKITVPLFIACLLLTSVILLFYGTVVWVSLVKTWGADMTVSLDHFRYALKNGKEYFVGSLTLSLIATPISALLGMLIAYLVVRKEFMGKRIVEFSSMLTFAIPGIVLGISYVLAFNQPPVLLTGTAAIIVVALVFRTLSIGVEAGTNCLRQVDASIEEASASLGASSAVTFWRVSLPLMKSAFFVSLVNAFCRAMTSISAVIFLVSFNWNLLTVLIMSNVEASKFGLAAAYCVILMMIVCVAFGIIHLVVGRLNYGTKKRRVYSE